MIRSFLICLKKKRTQNQVSMNKTGLTLIELMIAMCLSLLVIAPIVSLFVSLGRSYTSQETAAGVQQDVRAVVDFMLHDLRMAGLDPLGSADTGIEIADISKIRVTSDRNLNGTIDESDDESVSYSYDSGNNRLNQILYEDSGSEDIRILMEDVTEMTFAYLDVDSTSTATLADIRSVEIVMTVQGSAGRDQTITRTYTTRVACRNMAL